MTSLGSTVTSAIAWIDVRAFPPPRWDSTGKLTPKPLGHLLSCLHTGFPILSTYYITEVKNILVDRSRIRQLPNNDITLLAIYKKLNFEVQNLSHVVGTQV